MHRITAAEIANYNADRYLRRKERIERMKNEQPRLGPRLTFLHYIYDEKMNIKDAVWKILKEFPAINVDDIIRWYNEEENRRLKERSNSDEAR